MDMPGLYCPECDVYLDHGASEPSDAHVESSAHVKNVTDRKARAREAAEIPEIPIPAFRPMRTPPAIMLRTPPVFPYGL